MQVSVPSLPYRDNGDDPTASDLLDRELAVDTPDTVPYRDIKWAIIHRKDYGYNDEFFRDGTVDEVDSLLDSHWSGESVSFDFKEIAEAGIIACKRNSHTAFAITGFDYEPKYYRYEDYDYVIDGGTRDELKKENLVLAIYPHKREFGTFYANGKPFMHYHGGGRSTCMSTDNQIASQDTSFNEFFCVDDLLQNKRKLEKRFQLINANSYLHSNPRNLPYPSEDLADMRRNRGWERHDRTFN